jgi:hypothetical protein
MQLPMPLLKQGKGPQRRLTRKDFPLSLQESKYSLIKLRQSFQIPSKHIGLYELNLLKLK